MKKIISTIFILALINLTATAQNDRRQNDPKSEGRDNSNRINPRLMDQLDLTATQSEQVKIINNEYRDKMQEMIKSDLTVDQRKARRNEFEEYRRAKFMTILTPAQIVKLRELERADRPGAAADMDYKIKTKDENGDKTKIKVKTESD